MSKENTARQVTALTDKDEICALKFISNVQRESHGIDREALQAICAEWLAAQWVPCAERLPEAKEGWEHSRQVLVWYSANQEQVANFSIAYYHYNSPYKGSGWIDWAYLGRVPVMWCELSNLQIEHNAYPINADEPPFYESEGEQG